MYTYGIRIYNEANQNLQKTMKATETGNLGMVIENDSTDEIGDLINGYNSMSKRLDETVNEVYQSKIKEKNTR